MNLLWDIYWPVFTAAIVIGVVGGAIAFRQRTKQTGGGHRRYLILVGAVTLALAVGAIWHGPVGMGERFATEIDQQAQQVVVNYEMQPVKAVAARDPIKRTVLLSGPADDFQRPELARIMEVIPGVATARWTDSPAGFSLPLLLELELAALISFGLGLLLAYLLELRRRSNAQWSW